jgi:DNA-binding NtrC family response regulator
MALKPQSPRKSAVVIVDDHPVLRTGLIQLIRGQPDLDCVGLADNTAGAKQLVEKSVPDLMILDLRLKSGDAPRLDQDIASRAPQDKGACLFAIRRVDFRRAKAPRRRAGLRHERERHRGTLARHTKNPGR